MAQQTINVGASPNDGTGTPLRTAFQYTNSNFSELYTATGPSGNNIVVPGSATITGALTVRTDKLKVDASGVGVNTTSTTLGGGVMAIEHASNNGLVINSTAGSPTLYLRNVADSNLAKLLFTDNGLTFDTANGGTRMTLNSTGLGVGVSPNDRLTVLADNYLSFQTSTLTFNSGRVGRIGAVSSGSGNGYLVFETYKGGSGGGERMRIDSDGNVGIGVTPSAWQSDFRALQVSSSGSYLTSYISGATVNQWLFIGNNAFYDTVDSRWEYIRSKPSAQYIQYNNEHQWLRDTGTQTAGAACSFTQAMTLDASGNLLVGTTSAGGNRLNVQTASGDCTVLIKSTAASTNAALTIDYVNTYGNINFSKSGTSKWSIGILNDSASTPTFKVFNDAAAGVYVTYGATSWTGTSDERLKDIIEPISNAVSKIGSLRSVIGKFKTDSEGTRRSFLIAQDVQSVLPEAVDASNPDKLGVAYTDVIPLLVAAIKELTARVQTLEAK
jgi:hypothetical protein